MFTTTLGLDIGSNSVGSAWVDLQKKIIKMGDSVFPAGVEDSEIKRGTPKNQSRREKRTGRKITKRRSQRKHEMRKFLLQNNWMPNDARTERNWLEENNPWLLRRKGLTRELKPNEFGRILLHLAQRRGAYGFSVDEEDEDAGKIKDAISHTLKAMKEAKAKTFGELMAIKYEERRKIVGSKGKEIRRPIRNRTKATGEGTYEFCTDRDLTWDEFDILWKIQSSFNGELAKQLNDEKRKELDNPTGDKTWRYKGILLGQRKTYWDIGTMARCDLEPTDLRCSKGDMYAQEFLVLETVNNIRITKRGELQRRLDKDEREKVISVLENQKTASVSTVRKALGLDKGQNKTTYTISLENDENRELNTNWFKREIIGSFGKDLWNLMSDNLKESLNKALLKFDPQEKKDCEKIKEGSSKWWGFNDEQTDHLLEAWKKRPKIDSRVNYSRRAIKNLLPYMRDGFSVNEARQRFAEDAENGASDVQRQRYSFETRAGNKRLRQYISKHPDLLPPAPDNLSNPVVRKAIHEVRRHIQAYIRKFRCKPDRVVIELTREARQSAVIRNKQLSENRQREKKKKDIIKQYSLEDLTKTQQEKAVKRILLYVDEQKNCCAYCDNPLSKENSTADVARGIGVELDHIIPESRGGDNGLNNLVLCHTGCNRGKGNKTPKEWLIEEEFNRVEQRLAHLKDDNKKKWDNLHQEVSDLDGFVESQLSDTAYASRQVARWLESTLYGNINDGKRHVFTTKGRYTSILRNDWGLFPDRKNEKEETKKNRADHRHHAIDAVIIALSGPERLSTLAKAAEAQELAKAEGYLTSKREPVRPPWGDFDTFRSDVMKEYNNLVVTHRPEARKITGALHNDTQYGPIIDDKGDMTEFSTLRIFTFEITPNHLRVPNEWEKLRIELDNCVSKLGKKKIRLQMLSLVDVPPTKSGIVRDRWLREEIRDCLRQKGINPDSPFKTDSEKKFFKKNLKEVVKNKGLFLKSGVPLRRVTLLKAPTVEKIRRKCWNSVTGKMNKETSLQSLRLYETQNNHHIEIRKNEKGKWIGEVVTTFDAAQRVRPSKESGLNPQSAVNRDDTKAGKFIMSLSIGETVYMKHPQTNKPDYFVVFKIDGTGNIHFTPHYDAGRSKETEKYPSREDVKYKNNKTGGINPEQLQSLGIDEINSPKKVWVGPLSDVKILKKD
ncbi:MAG: type II CRISPR RNA-guided endonuclease Cas9 [Sedimentisphaerales bacterium]|nr:type II CRISPR RNA-guided endonuclease Cas9 [Sedimentisphaerales bacterium]